MKFEKFLFFDTFLIFTIYNLNNQNFISENCKKNSQETSWPILG